MRVSNKGFTMVEILVVLLIIGILAAVATPLYLAQTQRAKASEAVATMGMMRQAERDYFGRHNSYLNVVSPDLANDPEAASNKGLGINVGTAQHFSNAVYNVTVGATSARFATPAAVDFIIAADGSASAVCAGNATDCAINAADVTNYRLEMDNSGRVFISYDGGTAWTTW